MDHYNQKSHEKWPSFLPPSGLRTADTATCTGESHYSMGLVSETCYRLLGGFAHGVTECASAYQGKEAVTPECKVVVFSRARAECGRSSVLTTCTGAVAKWMQFAG